MTLPSTDTVVTFPSGALVSTGRILHVEGLPDGRAGVLLDVTAVHPRDETWPDQGSDRALIRVGDEEITLLDGVVGATDGQILAVGRDVPVKKGAEGWSFVVVHVVEPNAALHEGREVEVHVDAEHRRALSLGHTACHLASLALNGALAPSWTKPAGTDPLGSPDFDHLAIQTSTILEYGSRDVYRIGKSLRKKGFSASALLDGASSVQAAVDSRLASWSAVGSEVQIVCEGDRLTDRRYWQCTLDGELVRIPCGGTHAREISELGVLTVLLETAEAEAALAVTMTTSSLPVTS